MSTKFGLRRDLVPAANIVADFLALDDVGGAPAKAAFDMVILAGNAILSTATAAFAVAREKGVPVLVTGGVGHSTSLLHEAVAGAYPDVPVQGRTEADILREVAIRFGGLDPGQVVVEPASTNCGENAAFSLRRLQDLALRPRSVLLVQDPLMQRRTDASFRRAWRDAPWPTAFLNWPTFRPSLAWTDGEVRFGAQCPRPLWSGQRFLSLLLGEVPRLRDDERGYGPLGTGFIVHVDIPADVEVAYGRLSAYFADDAPALSRRIGR
ncbi:YdcF family protein [uncultured Alsobacter sp.]|uniref:YdcF family protein n=1 Tax=uncultured Alsobacter sp. TaxID=1748258 RepID=UPI0025D4A63F|nr:YdcF family protein [uncultured Alsobacter sp.]